MPLRIDYHYQNPYNKWKASWYTSQTVLQQGIATGNRYLPAFNNFTGYYTHITGITVTNVALVQSTDYLAYPSVGFNPEEIDQGTVTDVASNAILLRATGQLGAAFYARSMWLRGIPDDYIAYDANYNRIIAPVLLRQIGIFVNALTNKTSVPLCIRCIDRGGGNPFVDITGIGVTTGAVPLVILTTAAATGYTVGQVVRVKGCRGENLKQNPPGRLGVNGLWTVSAVTATTVTIALPSGYLPGVPVLRVMGKIRSNNYVYAPISAVTFQRFGSRITPGLRGGTRGAKRKRLPSI